MTTLKGLFSSECKFIAGATDVNQIPNNIYMPEVAFVGRSNVGKSSLINAVVGKRDCARVSKTPGRTQQINFFSLAEKISLADLPGYGYAVVSKKTRKIWNDLIVDYLLGRQNLRRVFLLIDSRHGLKDNDEKIMDLLDDSAVVYQVVLTKVDKIGDIPAAIENVNKKINKRVAAFPEIIASSSEKFIGIREIQAEILSLVS